MEGRPVGQTTASERDGARSLTPNEEGVGLGLKRQEGAPVLLGGSFGKKPTFSGKGEMEPDEEGWRAFFPPLENIGASTWGQSKEDALENIQEVLAMIVEELSGEGRPVPADGQTTASERATVTINV